MKIVNLTKHDVNVVNNNNEVVTFKPSGSVARVSINQEVFGEIGDFKVYKKVYGEIDFGIEIEPYTVYIVSNEVLRALNEQRNPLVYQFIAPNTFKSVRDADNNIEKVYGFMI